MGGWPDLLAAGKRTSLGYEQNYGTPHGNNVTFPRLAPSPTVSPPAAQSSPFFGVQAGQGQSVRATQPDPQATLLQELGLAYSGLEGFDEAASVGQAQLGAQMQSQLKHLLDTADTPRPLGSPMAQGFSPQAWGASSPKAKAASTKPSELRQPGPEYRGPQLEPPDTPMTLDFVMGLVRHFQHHKTTPLPARYLCRLLDDAERILEARDKDGPVHQLSLSTRRTRPNEPDSLVIVGDLHGQLADLLWIFFKVGVPSPSNRYLVNGDVCDRGENATEIWALLRGSREIPL
ncbi:unnamed protein product [Effrenium voratum]|nr:unnamed protein product [Effrenium voratum]